MLMALRGARLSLCVVQERFLNNRMPNVYDTVVVRDRPLLEADLLIRAPSHDATYPIFGAS